MDWLVKQVRDVTTQSQYYQMFSSSLRCYWTQIQLLPGGHVIKSEGLKKNGILFSFAKSSSNRYFAYFSVKRQCGCCWIGRGREGGDWGASGFVG